MNLFADVVATPVGSCVVTMRGARVAGVRMGDRLRAGELPRRLPRARRWLAAWFAGRPSSPRLDLSGVTAFERRVYSAARRIRRGGTKSYGDLARAAGLPGAARAVGGAMGRNPVTFFIP